MNDTQNPSLGNPRRSFLSGAVAGITGGALAVSPATVGTAGLAVPAANRTGLHPDGAPAADVGYSPGILGEGQHIVCVSGQGPKDVNADMETQMRQTFDRIGRVLEAAGASFENVVLLRSFFVHLARDLPVYRKVRLDYLKKPYPASTAVGTTELAIPGLEIEIEALAII